MDFAASTRIISSPVSSSVLASVTTEGGNSEENPCASARARISVSCTPARPITSETVPVGYSEPSGQPVNFNTTLWSIGSASPDTINGTCMRFQSGMRRVRPLSTISFPTKKSRERVRISTTFPSRRGLPDFGSRALPTTSTRTISP